MKEDLKKLELENALLKEKAGHLSQIAGLRRGALNNSLSGLAGSMQTQDNITSLIPLFTSNLYAPLTLNYTLLTFLYKSHGVLQTMIDEPVLDAFRGGLDINSPELGSDIQELEQFAEERGIWETVKCFLIWGRLYGGSGLIINAGQDPKEPLDPKQIQRGMLELYDADRWEFSGAPRHAKKFTFYGHELDASRVITFAGKRAPRMIRAQLSGWGTSELERAVEDFNMWLRGRNVLYEILDEAKVDVYGIENYAATLALPDGEEVVRRRIQATNQIKNFCNALILDKNDEYKVISNNFSGLAEVMKENRIGIAAALRMPMSKIFGLSAAGFNSGEDDIENYNAMVTSQVREPAKPILRKVIRLLMLAVYGQEFEFTFDFKPLRVLGLNEMETANASKQTRYLALYQANVLSAKELGESLAKDKLLPIETAAQRGELPDHPVTVPGEEKLFGDQLTEEVKSEGAPAETAAPEVPYT
jgi:phage-related protein (TIGR01555 family)